MNHPNRTRRLPPWLAVLFAALACQTAPADGPPLIEIPADPRPDLSRTPIVPSRVMALPAADAPAAAPNRVRLFRVQPGFLSDVPWLEDDRATRTADPDPDFFSFSVGNDNPNFDFRVKGDPGGVGYSRVNSQVQLFDTSKTALNMGLQAVTPRGLASDGLADNRGSTVVTPGFSLYHEMDEGVGLQAYVGKNLPVSNYTAQPVRREVQYGVAVTRPVTTNQVDPLSNLYMSLGALGQLRAEADGGRTINWDVMPGMHLRLADNWWVSGGLVLPVGPTRSDTGGHWRLTCQWQF